MKKTPTLDEVFLVQNQNIINVGSAYTRKPSRTETKVAQRTGSRTLAGYVVRKRMMSEGEMKPEFDSIVQKHAEKLAQELGTEDVDTIRACLEDMAHEIEGAEGEDPAELDKDGPEPGTTGGEERDA